MRSSASHSVIVGTYKINGLQVVARLALSVIRRFWAWSGAAVLSLLLFYWLYGGLLAFALVCFGVSGVLYKAGDRLLYHPDQV